MCRSKIIVIIVRTFFKRNQKKKTEGILELFISPHLSISKTGTGKSGF